MGNMPLEDYLSNTSKSLEMINAERILKSFPDVVGNVPLEDSLFEHFMGIKTNMDWVFNFSAMNELDNHLRSCSSQLKW